MIQLGGVRKKFVFHWGINWGSIKISLYATHLIALKIFANVKGQNFIDQPLNIVHSKRRNWDFYNFYSTF